MVKKICPVCDQVMKGNHYCSVCKRWVRHPYETKIDYYMNESHPADERGCEYHEPSFMKNPVQKRPINPASSGGGMQSSPMRRMAGSGANGQRRTQTQPAPSDAAKIIWFILLVLFLINFIIPLLSIAI